MSHSPTSPRPTITRFIAAAILGVLASASCAWADGLFLPEKTVEKTPAIPVERAVISWKDGVETLILASSADSDSQKLGWLIPIPAAPQKIEPQTPGGLKTLVSCIQPQITNDLGWELIGVIAVAFGGNAFLAILMFKRQWLAGFLPAAIVVILLAGVLSPMLGPRNLSVALVGPGAGRENGRTHVLRHQRLEAQGTGRSRRLAHPKRFRPASARRRPTHRRVYPRRLALCRR